jgi:hypothetical protein
VCPDRCCRVWTCCSCLIMIISLGTSTFTQQLVAYNALVPASAGPSLAPGNLPRSEEWVSFSMGSGSDSTSTATDGSGATYSAPMDMIAAMYSGVLTSNIDPVSPSCPSGNCTWPATPTMAVCGECAALDYGEPDCYFVCDDPGATGWRACNYTLLEMTDRSSHRSSDYSEWLSASD